MIAPRRDPELLLRRYWDKPDIRVVSAGLSLLSASYRIALATRDRAYRWRLLRTGRLSCPVISVGNITLGGSGKTPLVELVVQILLEAGAAPAVLSRGYGRNTRGAHIVADRHQVRLSPRAAGDEPVLLAERLPGVAIVVGENRLDAGRLAIETCAAGAVVLDDGFQHRTLAKDLEIVAINGRAPWGNQRLFPRGMLREPLSALERADLLVATNPPRAADVDSLERVARRYTRAPLLVARYELLDARRVNGEGALHVGALEGCRLLAFAGVGSPRGFAETLASAGVRLAGLVEYPDHHWYTESDLRDLDAQARDLGAEGLITTEKDWMRLRGLERPGVPLWILSVRLVLESGREILTDALGRVLRAAARSS
jgi:tetraacyldisaccharide 4'-kinase